MESEKYSSSKSDKPIIEVFDLSSSLNLLLLSSDSADKKEQATKKTDIIILSSESEDENDIFEDNFILLSGDSDSATDAGDFFSENDQFNGITKSSGIIGEPPKKKQRQSSKLVTPLTFKIDSANLNDLTLTRFKKERGNLARLLFDDINKRALGELLPLDMEIKWSKTLRKTAGLFCGSKNRHGIYSGHINLSTKVIDGYNKLFSTLAHEMCHAADFFREKTLKLGHGPSWKAWAAKVCRVYPNLKITTKHNYDIFYNHWYRCLLSTCGTIYKRHSNSIDIEKKVCGKCKGRLEHLPKNHPLRKTLDLDSKSSG